MQSKGNAPTAAQKRWREAVRGLGSIISGEDAVIHHAVGATGKHNKVAIGHWWVLPLTHDEHLALHAGDTFGYESRKEFEKTEFHKLAIMLTKKEGSECPPKGAFSAIMDYHK